MINSLFSLYQKLVDFKELCSCKYPRHASRRPFSHPEITWPAPRTNSKGCLRSNEESNLVPSSSLPYIMSLKLCFLNDIYGTYCIVDLQSVTIFSLNITNFWLLLKFVLYCILSNEHCTHTKTRIFRRSFSSAATALMKKRAIKTISAYFIAKICKE